MKSHTAKIVDEHQTKLAFVVPCYNEEEAIGNCIKILLMQLDSLASRQLCSKDESFILLVDDGSNDNTWDLIRIASKHDKRVNGLRLSRNKGHQVALVAGISTAVENADACITIDADLQDDVNACAAMVREFLDGCDVVYGVRRDRSVDSPSKKLFASTFYRFVNALGVEIVPEHGDFRLLSARAASQLLLYREGALFMRGVIPILGFRSSLVEYARLERSSGRSKYPFKKSMELATNGIISFSEKPLEWIMLIGLAASASAIVYLIYAVIAFLHGNALPGWTSTIAVITIIGSMQLLCLGVIAAYLARMYREVKCRPLYHKREAVGEKVGLDCL